MAHAKKESILTLVWVWVWVRASLRTWRTWAGGTCWTSCWRSADSGRSRHSSPQDQWRTGNISWRGRKSSLRGETCSGNYASNYPEVRDGWLAGLTEASWCDAVGDSVQSQLTERERDITTPAVWRTLLTFFLTPSHHITIASHPRILFFKSITCIQTEFFKN